MAANYQYFAMFEELTEAVRSLKPVTYLLVEVEDRVHGHGDPPPPCQRSTASTRHNSGRPPVGNWWTCTEKEREQYHGHGKKIKEKCHQHAFAPAGQ